MQFQVPAVGTFKRRRQITIVRQPATPAKRRTNKAHLFAAIRPNKPIIHRGRLRFAKRAHFGIKKPERGVQRGLDEGFDGHVFHERIL
jgi:hypothetical protein